MKFTEEQMKKNAIEKLNKYKDRKPCEICGNTNWQINSVVWQLIESENLSQYSGEIALMPLMSLMCSRCGNVRLLNALQLGILEKDTHREDDHAK